MCVLPSAHLVLTADLARAQLRPGDSLCTRRAYISLPRREVLPFA